MSQKIWPRMISDQKTRKIAKNRRKNRVQLTILIWAYIFPEKYLFIFEHYVIQTVHSKLLHIFIQNWVLGNYFSQVFSLIIPIFHYFLLKLMQKCWWIIPRVTRLGVFSPFGRLFTSGIFWSPKFRATLPSLPPEKVMY
jgi:hypothetical protein